MHSNSLVIKADRKTWRENQGTGSPGRRTAVEPSVRVSISDFSFKLVIAFRHLTSYPVIFLPLRANVLLF